MKPMQFSPEIKPGTGDSEMHYCNNVLRILQQTAMKMHKY